MHSKVELYAIIRAKILPPDGMLEDKYSYDIVSLLSGFADQFRRGQDDANCFGKDEDRSKKNRGGGDEFMDVD